MPRKSSHRDASDADQLFFDFSGASSTSATAEEPALAVAALEPVIRYSREDTADSSPALALASALELSALDQRFADWLVSRTETAREHDRDAPSLLWLGGALVSQAADRGRAFLDLTRAPAHWPGAARVWPSLEEWRVALAESGLAALAEAPLEEEDGDPDYQPAYPLTLAHGGEALYLSAYWRAESFVAAEIRRRIEAPAPLTDASPEEIARVLDQVFEDAAPPFTELDWQRAAVYLALRRGFLVISGGPGTGKTRVAGRLLQALSLLPTRRDVGPGQEFRCALAAPTGKAAARLQESLGNLATGGHLRITPAGTLHRLLGANPATRTLRHHAGNPLAEHLVILDECSMVDLKLMEQLFAALPAGAGLVLLGDKDQLAPVDVGGFLAEIRGRHPEGTLDVAARVELAAVFGPPALESVPAWERPTVYLQLQKNYRFGEGNAIHALSQAIRRGEIAEALALLERAETNPESTPGLRARRYAAASPPLAALEKLGREWFGGWSELSPADGLAALATRRVLSPLRGGPLGVVALNKLLQRVLRTSAPAAGRVADFYVGRPILVLKNDYAINLRNGDSGILLREQDGARRLRAWFPRDESTPAATAATAREAAQLPRALAPVRLPAHETAYAMTVHKSQGSEFREVALILPPTQSEVLSRELIYTAVTRASQAVEVWYEPAALRWTLERQAPRTSRLGDLLQTGCD